MKIGYIGLGKMGKNMVLRLLENNIKVVAWNRSSEPLTEVTLAGAERAENLADLISKLQSPKVIWLMLPAGEVVDQFIDQLFKLLSAGDLVIDGGNSFYGDSQRRAAKFAAKKIHFMDIGVSGGPDGARNGACLMIGGVTKDYQLILPVVRAAAAPGAYGHFGKVGSGHFAKMIHNGIEYGMMEAIAEGAAILEKSDFGFDLAEVFKIYNKRSVIESRLVGWLQKALAENPDLAEYSSMIGHTGEGEWSVKTASHLKVEVPVIKASYQVRINSEEKSDNFRNKAISAMRGKFGGHAVREN